MYLWTTVLVATAVYCLYRYFKKHLAYFEEHGIPYVPGWPLLGNMAATALGREHITKTLDELYNVDPRAKYVGVFDFASPAVMIRDLELIKSITIKNFDSFPNHVTLIDETMDPLSGGTLMNMKGELWKETRQIMTPAFSASKLKGMYKLMVENAKNAVNYLEELPESEKKMLELKDFSTKYMSDVMANCAFGICVDSLKNPENDLYVIGKENSALNPTKTARLYVNRSFPVIGKWLQLRQVDAADEKKFIDIMRDIIKTRDEKGISRPDMIQLMMNAREKASENLKWDVTRMAALAFSFFAGGFDSTAAHLCIICHELANNPEMQKRLQAEVDEVMERSSGNPSYEDIQEMLYLDAVFNEASRRHTQVPYIDRVCDRPFELPPSLPGGKPFTIPKGMSVWLPTAPIYHDPQYYDRPEVFDPDRFYKKKLGVNDPTNLVYGMGQRGCIAPRFIALETKVLLFHMLTKFNFKPNERCPSVLKYCKRSYTVTAEGGFWASIEKRA